MRDARSGIALIIVLAIVAILSVLVIEFSYSVWVDMYLAGNYDARTQAVQAAKAGLDYAVYVLRRDEDTRVDWLGEEWARPLELTIGELVPPPDPEEEEDTVDTEAREEWKRQRPVEARVGGTAKVLIVDEERKISLALLNTSSAPFVIDALERLIDGLYVPGAGFRGNEIVDQMVDWVDENEDGSWEFIYETLEEPYVAMNRPFTTVHELRLLADMTDALLYGTVPYPEVEPGYDEDDDTDWVDAESQLGPDDAYGLFNFVHTQSTHLTNVNTAPREVLTALFDDNEAVADEILAHRREKAFSSADELQSIVIDAGGAAGDREYKAKYRRAPLGVKSEYFTITSIGEYRGVRAQLTAVVHRDSSYVSVQYYRIEIVE